MYPSPWSILQDWSSPTLYSVAVEQSKLHATSTTSAICGAWITQTRPRTKRSAYFSFQMSITMSVILHCLFHLLLHAGFCILMGELVDTCSHCPDCGAIKIGESFEGLSDLRIHGLKKKLKTLAVVTVSSNLATIAPSMNAHALSLYRLPWPSDCENWCSSSDSGQIPATLFWLLSWATYSRILHPMHSDWWRHDSACDKPIVPRWW